VPLPLYEALLEGRKCPYLCIDPAGGEKVPLPLYEALLEGRKRPYLLLTIL
jgi:hypothetical protein